MNFKDSEIKIIQVALGDRQEKLLTLKENWESYEWDNIGNMQNMFANQQAFETIKQDRLETFKTELENIEKLLEKISEEM